MTFSSLAFLFVFFPIVFLLYWVCTNSILRNLLLIAASLIFYAYGEPVAVFIMLISIGVNYICGLMCAETFFRDYQRGIGASEVIRKIGLVAAVVLNIGLLFVFKYADFFLDSVGSDYRLNLGLPIGISFFTFQGLSYVVDVYRDRDNLQKNPLAVMLYISFFPQLIAGPIVKYHDIREQLKSREFNGQRIADGIQRFIFGLGKKVLIAGPMGLMVDTLFVRDVAGLGILSAWIAAISYSFQIYFDFSGYSDMAIGLGCIFGFDFKENFDKPYAAANMQQFWRKWHISLSTWFKEYVYIPLGGNRKGRVRTYINKFIVFILTGLWHGANWTFVCWGVLHGMALIVEDTIKGFLGKKEGDSNRVVSFLGRVLGHIYTVVFIIITFVIFRADNMAYALQMIGRMFSGTGSDAVAISMLTPDYCIALGLAVVLSTTLIDKAFGKAKVWVMRLLSIVIYIVSIIMLISGGYNPFIYFRF